MVPAFFRLSPVILAVRIGQIKKVLEREKSRLIFRPYLANDHGPSRLKARLIATAL